MHFLQEKIDKKRFLIICAQQEAPYSCRYLFTFPFIYADYSFCQETIATK